MPILINSANYIDNFGNSTPFYVGNAGDKFTVEYTIQSLIRMTSVGNPLIIDTSLNQVLSSNASWITEGFRVGLEVNIKIHSAGGAVIYDFNTSITYVDDILCDFSGLVYWYTQTAGEFVVIVALEPGNPSSLQARATLDCLFNHVKNSVPGAPASLIDAEVTRAVFNNIYLMAVGAIVQADLVGNQSGQFLISAELERNPQLPDFWFSHTIRFVFINSGAYDQTWFFSSEALKTFMKMEWAAVAGEPFARSEASYQYAGNTGWFDEPHNTSIIDSSLIQGLSGIDYCDPTTGDIIVDGPLANLGIGSEYISIDDDYYRNRLIPQQELTMAIGTEAVAVGVIASFINEFGAGYTIEINSIVSVVNVHTINVTITPNAQFQTFMDSVDNGDRLFYLWIKCGNLNLLAFKSQLECEPPVGGPLIMEQDYGYLDHSQNVDTIVGDQTGFIADTGDDVAYLGTFLLVKNTIYESFSVKIEAFNTSTLEDFTLDQRTFSFNAVQISGAGVYLLNESQSINSELPTTSLKRETILVLEPSLDTPTEYGVKIYAPWILNWRYWLAQTNASVDFNPTQNKNWEQYDNLGDWTVRTELQLIKDGLAFVHDNEIVIEPYNNEANIVSTLEAFLLPALTPISVIPTGSLVKMVATHVNLTGAWDQALTWGTITVESFEQAPRPICSSVVPFDNNTSNPITPISGLLVNILYPQPDTAVLECVFDSNNINLTNGVNFTAKIKENTVVLLDGKRTTSGALKNTTAAGIKQLA